LCRSRQFIGITAGRKGESMKYYVYVSDSKVDMLFAQIPSRFAERLAIELKIDFKIISASVSSGASNETRFSRLAIVKQYIEKHENVGSIDEPNEYFIGKMQMSWSKFPFTSQMVYFGGIANQTALGLAGSLKHVIGESQPPEKFQWSLSDLGGAYVGLIDALNPDEPSNQVPAEKVTSLVARMTQEIISTGNTQNLEFLARKLKEGYSRHYDKKVLLGSPIYVSLS